MIALTAQQKYLVPEAKAQGYKATTDIACLTGTALVDSGGDLNRAVEIMEAALSGRRRALIGSEMQAAIHLARAYRTLDRDVEAERWELLVRTQLKTHVNVKFEAAELRDFVRWTRCLHCNSGEWLMEGLDDLFVGARPVPVTNNQKCDLCREVPEPGHPLLLCSRCRTARCASPSSESLILQTAPRRASARPGTTTKPRASASPPRSSRSSTWADRRATTS